TKPMPRRPGGTWPTSTPLKQMLPDVGCSMPAIMFIVVVLPHPEGPSSATNSLSGMNKVSASTAVTEPNTFVRSFRSIAAIMTRVSLAEIVENLTRERSTCVARLWQTAHTQPCDLPQTAGQWLRRGRAGKLAIHGMGYAPHARDVEHVQIRSAEHYACEILDGEVN